MTNAEQFSSVTYIYPPETGRSADHAAQQLAANPLPNYDLAVARTRISKKEHHFDGGSIQDRRYKLNDGSTYRAQHFMPQYPESDIFVAYTTPWCTDLEGYNTELGKALAKAGLPALAIGPENSGSFKASTRLAKTTIGNTQILAHDAEAINGILDDFDDEQLYAPGLVTLAGYSRGGMIGTGVAAYASRHGRRIGFASFRDKCMSRPVRLNDITADGTLGYFLRQEPQELLHCLAEYDARELRHLTRTAPLKLGFWLTQLATGYDIFRGNTGGFIENLPVNSAMHLDMFEQSRFNQWSDITDRYDRHPNIAVDVWKGVHMTGVSKRANERTVKLLSYAHESLLKDSVQIVDTKKIAVQVNEELPFKLAASP